MAPNVCRKTSEDHFLEVTQKNVGKICTTFWASLGKFGQKSFALPKICLLLQICHLHFKTSQIGRSAIFNNSICKSLRNRYSAHWEQQARVAERRKSWYASPNLSRAMWLYKHRMDGECTNNFELSRLWSALAAFPAVCMYVWVWLICPLSSCARLSGKFAFLRNSFWNFSVRCAKTELQLCGVWKLPFCDHRAIKFTQTAVLVTKQLETHCYSYSIFSSYVTNG